MTDANFVPVEGFDRKRNKVNQLQPGGLCFVVAYVVSSVQGRVTLLLSPPKTT
jgi:hypothetical protein